MNNSKKYFTTIENVKDTLDEYGVAIIPSLLNEEECDNMVNNMWNYLEHITKDWDNSEDYSILGQIWNYLTSSEKKDPYKVKSIKKNDPATWKHIYNLTGPNLIFQYWNIGHSQMCWDVRQNPKIVDIFAKIFNVDRTELIASFDGASIQLPPEVTKFGWREKSKEWFHTDHSYIDSTFKNVQSWVTAFDVNENDATLVILESSHKYHKDCGELFNITSPKNFKVLSKEELDFYLDKCNKNYITCPKGSLVLWDSRTVHYACEASQKRINQNIRCISYLCYASKKLLDESNKKIRKTAFDHLYSSNHDPLNVTLKYNSPYDDNDDITTKINRPVLTELGLNLC
jgi:hypothetical protein